MGRVERGNWDDRWRARATTHLLLAGRRADRHRQAEQKMEDLRARSRAQSDKSGKSALSWAYPVFLSVGGFFPTLLRYVDDRGRGEGEGGQVIEGAVDTLTDQAGRWVIHSHGGSANHLI